MYTADSDTHSYMINVCAALDNDNYCHDTPHNNAAICQIPKGGIKPWVFKFEVYLKRLVFFHSGIKLCLNAK